MRFKQIVSKQYVNYNDKVYDICVEDSHSYNIEGIISHNSGG